MPSAGKTAEEAVELAERIRLLFGRRRWIVSSEARFQDEFERFLRDEDITFEREVRLTPTERIDFLCPLGDGPEALGLELKIKGSCNSVLRQLSAYAESPRIGALLLVSTQMKHRGLPPAICGVPLRVAQAFPL